jgi:hypothetical protein
MLGFERLGTVACTSIEARSASEIRRGVRQKGYRGDTAIRCSKTRNEKMVE